MYVPSLESPESSSPVITRAVAAALADEEFRPFEFAFWQKIVLSLLSFFPPIVSSNMAQWNVTRAALDPSLALTLDVDRLVAERLKDYDTHPGPFDCVVVGSALGGAVAHLAAALQAPFLPQPFVLNFRGGSRDDSVEPHFQLARDLAEHIFRNNDDVLAIGHFDPVHDGWITRTVTHLRLKLLHLPEGYRQFLDERLRPGGEILYLDCGAQWLQYVIHPRFVYQIGGWGGLSAREFIEGSQRIDDHLARRGSPHRGGWELEGQSPVVRFESEWGSEPGLDDALEGLARDQGFRFCRLSLSQPHDFSRLVFQAYKVLCEKGGLEPQGVAVEAFGQYDPVSVLRSSLLPLWLVFNTYDSLDFLKQSIPEFPTHKPVLFSGLVTMTQTPDMVPWEDWVKALEDLDWMNVGARSHRYPVDLAALWRGPEALRRWVRQNPAPIRASLEVEDLIELADCR